MLLIRIGCKFEYMKITAKGFTLVEIMIVVGILGVMAAIAIPNFFRARERAMTNACISNLKRIDDAKSLWAMRNVSGGESEPTWGDLVPDYLNKAPNCPMSGTYTIGPVKDYPTCSVSGHEITE